MTTESYVAILFLCPGFDLYVQVLMKPAAFRMDQLGRADWDGLIWMLQPGWSGWDGAVRRQHGIRSVIAHRCHENPFFRQNVRTGTI